jgi:D-inositol-3-phosphate glycosyltransferase
MSVYWEPGRGHIAFPELGGADVVLALNHEAARLISQEFSVPCQVLPPPVDMNFFRPVSSRDLERPTVLFAADLADPRKGGALLLKAWNHVHRRMPRARLVLAGSLGVAGWLQDHNGQRLASNLNLVKGASARSTVELRGPGALDDLPDLYSRAAVTALPSIHEMFGMVLTESLACGTPVVASSSGGPGEILRGSSVGVTVDLCDTRDLAGGARAQQLADAILRAIEIARTPGSAARCREYASRWSLDQIGPMAEDVLDRAVSHEKGAMPAMDPEVAGAEVAP